MSVKLFILQSSSIGSRLMRIINIHLKIYLRECNVIFH